jgi:hypothetical protein
MKNQTLIGTCALLINNMSNSRSAYYSIQGSNSNHDFLLVALKPLVFFSFQVPGLKNVCR